MIDIRAGVAAWLRTEMKKRKMTMSDLIRLALGNLQSSKTGAAR